MSARLKLSAIINDPLIVINDKEDLNIENNICRLLVKAMNKHNGNKSGAFAELGVPKRTVYNYIKYYSIVYDTVEKRYVSLRGIMYNADHQDRYTGVVREIRARKKN